MALPLLGSSQNFDVVIDEQLSDFFYGKSYCESIDSLINVAFIQNDNNQVAELHGLKALCFSGITEKDSIDRCITKLIKAKTPRAEGLRKSIQGHVQLGQEEDELAIQSFIKAIELYDPVRDKELIIISQLAVSWAYYGIFSFDLSIKHGALALDNARDNKNLYNVIEGLDILANSSLRLGDSLNADSYFKEYLAIASTINNPLVNYWANSSTGHNFAFAENHDSAHYYYQRSYDASLALQDSFLQLEALLYLGENAQMNSDSRSAIQYLKHLESFPSKYHRSALDRRANEYLALAYEDQGDYTKAYHYLNQYKEIDDKHWNNESREMALDFEAKYQSLQKDSEITKQELQLTRRTSERNIFLIGAAGLCMLLWFLFYRNKKNQKLSSEKIQNLEKKQKLIAMDFMVQGQEEERKRIAQDLHDGLGGLLASASIQMQKIQSEIEKFSDMNLFAKAEEIIDTAHKEVRRISHDMMPSALIDLGLVDAIEDLIEVTRRNHDLDIQFTSSDPDISLTDIQSVNLYRIIQEILSNTLKHSKASQFEISLVSTQDQIQLNTSDNGVGFELHKAKAKDGIGLRSVESRVQYLEGQTVIKSNLNEGTKYTISIPR